VQECGHHVAVADARRFHRSLLRRSLHGAC
jgi:hypothetical protein